MYPEDNCAGLVWIDPVDDIRTGEGWRDPPPLLVRLAGDVTEWEKDLGVAEYRTCGVPGIGFTLMEVGDDGREAFLPDTTPAQISGAFAAGTFGTGVF